MEPQPPSFHEDDADYKIALAAYKRKRGRLLISILLGDLSFTLLFIVLPFYYLCYDIPSEFSVQLTAIRGLDKPAPGASISPAFNVTLHANNRRGTERCYQHGEAVVSYAGFTIALGRVPGFCVPGKGAREMPFLAWADGVGLPEQVRDRMAVERRVGATQLEVEVKLFRRNDGSARPTWMFCGLTMDAAQPPNVAPCTVLALQNWFSKYQQHI